MSSTGIHIPICKVFQIKAKEGKLTKDNVKDIAINQMTFDELFNKIHVGSRWIPFRDMEEYYRKRNLYELSQNVRIVAQEVINTFAEDERF